MMGLTTKLFRRPTDPVYMGVDNFVLVEVILPVTGAAANNLNIPDQPYLKNKRIVGLEMYNDGDFPFSPSQTAMLPAAASLSVSFTAYSDKNDAIGVMGLWYKNIPFPNLHRIQNPNTDPFVRTIFPMSGNVFSWDKCYFTIGQNVGNSTPVSFLLGVYFVEQDPVDPTAVSQ